MELVKRKLPDIVFPETENINKLMADIIAKRLTAIESELMKQLQFAQPPIKGEITKGKIKWRGIKAVDCFETGEKWLEQRGKILGVKIKYRNPTFEESMSYKMKQDLKSSLDNYTWGSL
jgi:hypothetical protein